MDQQTIQDQLSQVRQTMQMENQRGALADQAKILELQQQEQDLVNQLIQLQQESTATATATIETTSAVATWKYDFDIDFNDIFGTSILNDRIQALLDAQREQLHSYYQALMEDRDNQIRDLRDEVDTEKQEGRQLLERATNAELEREDFKKRFENSAELIKELQTEVDRLKEREIELLKKAEEAHILYPHKVIDAVPSNVDAGEAIRQQRAAELALKPKVWDLQWADDIKKTEYKGIGEDGTELIIPRLELGKYNIQVGPRPEQTTPEVVVEDVQTSPVTPEETFPEVPTAEAPEVPSVPAPVVTGQPETGEDRGVTQTELETRLAQFAQEYGLVKGQVA